MTKTSVIMSLEIIILIVLDELELLSKRVACYSPDGQTSPQANPPFESEITTNQ